MSSRFPLFKKRDLLVFLAAAALAGIGFLSWIPQSGAPVDVIEQDGHEVRRISLNQISQPETLVLEGEIPVTILLEPGQVSIIKSSCPDQVCVNTGVLTRPGQSAVCLPARVAVRITGETRSDGQTPVDGMTG